MDLADGVLIKNNHISLGGGVAKVLALAMQRRQPGQKIQIEVRSLAELDAALTGGADSLLLDNMTPGGSQTCCRHCAQTYAEYSHRSLRRHHPGNRQRIREDRGDLYFRRRAHAFGEGHRSEHEDHCGNLLEIDPMGETLDLDVLQKSLFRNNL